MRYRVLTVLSLAFAFTGVLTIALWIRSAWVEDVIICRHGGEIQFGIISSNGDIWIEVKSSAFKAPLTDATYEHRTEEPTSVPKLRPGDLTWQWGSKYGYTADYLTDQRRDALQLQIYSIWESLEENQITEKVTKMLNEESLRISRMPRAEYRLFLPMWIVVAGTWLLPLVTLGIRLKRSRRRRMQLRKGLCLTCNYNLTGNVSGICPECGMAILPKQAVKGATA